MNDFILCEKHNYQRKFITSRIIMGKEFKAYEECPYCLKEKEVEKERIEIKKLYDKLDKSNIGRKYYPLTFKNLEIVSQSFKTAKNRAEKYCQNFDECFKRGLGIYFYGDNGRGKTALIACIFKELIKKGYEPYLTTMNELQGDIINNRVNLDDIKAKKILALDDIGSESYVKGDDTKWINELLFEIVAYRDKNLLPTLFTSNHKVSELMDNGVMKKTVERISTLGTAKIEIVSDKSFRVNKEVKLPF